MPRRASPRRRGKTGGSSIFAAVQHQLGDLLHARGRDAVALLDRERVIGFFEQDEWPLSRRTRVEFAFSIEGRRIARQLRGEKALVRTLAFPAGSVPKLGGANEVIRAERDPREPEKLLVAFAHGNVNPAEKEIVPVVDDALVRRQLGTRGALLRRNHGPERRRGRAVAHRHALMRLAAARAAVGVVVPGHRTLYFINPGKSFDA